MALLASAEVFQGLDGREANSLAQGVQQHSLSTAEKQTQTMNKRDAESGEGKVAAPSPARFSFVSNFMLHIIPRVSRCVRAGAGLRLSCGVLGYFRREEDVKAAPCPGTWL